MKKQPKENKLVQNLLMGLVIIVGIVPLGFFASVELGIAEAASEPPDENRMADPLDRYVDNVAFGVNEKLTFDINYGFINAGTATMEVARVVEYQQRPCYQIVTRALSNSFFSSFYKVEDRVESIIDAVGIYSWRFEKNLREGNYEADRVYSFDQRNSKVHYQQDTIDVPQFVQDAISVLYFVRTQELRVGESIFVDNFTDGKLYPLEVRIHEKETITVDAGTFDCIVVEPLTQSVGVFRHEGKLKVWMTDDRLKMPVLMKSKVLVGSISAELTDYSLGEIESF
ncbi:MAG: DUF3108 domain-containing protein [bacterium]|nr:DUF3108 domain-containing protein [bacterium]